MKILIDTYGADEGSKILVDGAVLALKEKDFVPVFVGNEKEIESHIRGRIKDYEIVHTEEYISNDEEPVRALRKKKDSSIVLAYNKLKEEGYDGLLSAGSTGALLAGGIFISKRIEGIDRPSLAAPLPSIGAYSMLMDTGANMDCKPAYLEEFAIMGKVFLENVIHIDKPSIGLLNVGTESHKGNKVAKEAHELLSKSDLNFKGNIEARDLFTGKVNLIVADGFAGNVAVKTAEGVISLFKSEMKDIFYRSFKNKMAGLAIKNDLAKEMGKYSSQNVGGVPLLGVKSYVYKAHGNSNDIAVSNAILGLIDYINMDVIRKIQGELNG
ncbi:phosphate acyltransferase PlsX [uncultured Anaerococcus sp.]|uniref:phosphate acyltransferase PlsX n=1 Tax=uncultured Anaerococcus sp. TaxID=293428 RepID=UPI0025E4B2FD|nr:phosphate acyltransferase PlsX [uncultured Anaerococcus sp.]